MALMLVEAGYHVTLLDFPEGDAALADCRRFDTFAPVTGDARDQSLLRKLVAKADIVIPLAAERAILDSGNGITLRLATVFGVSPRMRGSKSR